MFLNSEGEPYRLVSTVFNDAVRRARVHDFHFHDLRHIFASRLVMRGVDLRTVQVLMGHKTVNMTLRYSHLSPDHLRSAVEVLDREKSPINFHNTPVFDPVLPGVQKAAKLLIPKAMEKEGARWCRWSSKPV